MPSSTHPVERFSFSTALFGMLVLTLGMGSKGLRWMPLVIFISLANQIVFIALPLNHRINRLACFTFLLLTC